MVEGQASDSLPVFIIHYNAEDWCRSAIRTLQNSSIPVDIVVINNGGDADFGPAVNVIAPRRNLGYAGGANVALRKWLSGVEPYCVIGSHDLHVESDTLHELVAAADRARGFGILGPTTTTNWAGDYLGSEDGIEIRAGMSGTCLLYRRDCITDIGLFDEALRSYGEDNDICARASDAGWLVGRVSEARAEGIGTQHPGVRRRNVLANRLLIAWRRQGPAGVVSEYWIITKRIGLAATGRTEVGLLDSLSAAWLGTFRLARGILKKPPSH